MRTIDALLGETPALAGLRAEHREVMAGCATNRVFAVGEHLLRENEVAGEFFVIRHGDVALETFAPRGGTLTIETLHDGDLVGWSWLIPPHRTKFDARALTTTRALAFDGACLRGKCEQDHELGYALMVCITAVIVERLQATRLRLLDLYGHGSG